MGDEMKYDNPDRRATEEQMANNRRDSLPMTKPDGVKRFFADVNTNQCAECVLASDYDRLAEEVGRLRALLKVALPFVCVTDHEGRPEGELRDSYPDSSACIDRIRAKITQALAGGDCDE
jgi:hypothetical protein